MTARRWLHTARQTLSIRSHTIYSPTASVLSQHLSDLPTESSSVFLLSNTLPVDHLEPLISEINEHCPTSIGSFSACQAQTEPCISIATFSCPARCSDTGGGNDAAIKTFYTPLSGRADPEVGRWHRPRELQTEDLKGTEVGEMGQVGGEAGWAGVWKAEEGIERIPELEGSKAQSFLLLSDAHPSPVLNALDAMFPSSDRFGLLSAPTPFITGRPHTLFHNGQIYSTGTVGLALPHRLSLDIDYGLSPLTPPYRVVRAQGNLLLSIDDGIDGNPARTLITALHKQKGRAAITKEEEWFLSIGPTPSSASPGSAGSEEPGEPQNVVRILSGDPSKGALSLETEESLVPGQTVQFLYRPESSSPSIGTRLGERSLIFAGLARGHEEITAPMSSSTRSEPGFLGLSEDGFIHGRSVCKVPNARVSTTIE